MKAARASDELGGVRAAGLVAFAVLVLLPIVALLPGAVSAAGAAGEALTPRRLGLLLSSLRFAAAVGVTDALLGALAATWLWVRPGRARRWLPVIVLGVVLPAVAHAAAWAGAAELAPNVGLASAPGWLGAWLTESASLVAIAVVIAYAGLSTLERAPLEVARVQGGDASALARVAWPLVAPVVLAAFGATFALALGDYAVASSFAFDVYAMELYAEYSSSGSPASTIVLALPLLLVAVAVAVACAGPIRGAASRTPGGTPWLVRAAWPAWLRALLGVSIAAVVVWPLLAIASLLAQSGGVATAFASASAAGADLATSAAVAVSAGIVAAAVALAVSASARPRPAGRALWAVAVAALALPAPVVGAGLAATWNHGATSAVYDTPVVVVLASLARFLPLAVLLVSAAAARMDVRGAEAALVAERPRRAYLHAVLPSLAAPALVAVFAVAALSLGELGATLMVLPPGLGTVVTRLYNLLHYGASAEVAGLALAVAGMAVAASLAAWALAARAYPKGARA